MANVRWWILLLAAVLFSLSGCAAKDEWSSWASHPLQFTSWDHLLTPPVDLSGHWRGEWRGPGLFGSMRTSAVQATFEQRDGIGFGRFVMQDAVAADVPWVLRQQGSRGVMLAYDVDGRTMTARHVDGARLFTMWLSLVDDRLVGTIDSDAPVMIVLTRDPAATR